MASTKAWIAVHTAKGFTNYTTFSLWDTYRALHPTVYHHQHQTKYGYGAIDARTLPAKCAQDVAVWSHYANENWCMIGYHAVPVIADAVLKGRVERMHRRYWMPA